MASKESNIQYAQHSNTDRWHHLLERPTFQCCGRKCSYNENRKDEEQQIKCIEIKGDKDRRRRSVAHDNVGLDISLAGEPPKFIEAEDHCRHGNEYKQGSKRLNKN